MAGFICSRYGSRERLDGCEECSIRQECDSAKYPKLLDAVRLHRDDQETPAAQEEDPLANDAAGVLFELLDAAARNPAGWIACREKFRQGRHTSLRSLAATMGLNSKQSLAYRLKIFCKQAPKVLSEVLPTDRRCQGK